LNKNKDISIKSDHEKGIKKPQKYVIGVTVSTQLANKIDRFAIKKGITRTEAARLVLVDYFKQPKNAARLAPSALIITELPDFMGAAQV
jgi:hypothetical protein